MRVYKMNSKMYNNSGVVDRGIGDTRESRVAHLEDILWKIEGSRN